MLPLPIEDLVNSISMLPGIGKKGSTKIVLDYLNSPSQTQDSILKSFIDVRQKITYCPICSYLSTENDDCVVCKDNTRNKNQIMIVVSPFDIISLEVNNLYKGKYHVLNQLINPLDNILPNATTLYDLEHRIEKYFRENKVDFLELIYFVKHSFAASTTYAYIKDYIEKSKFSDRIKLVQLATGLPTNFSIQNMDQDTFTIAYENRK